jgi:hypothetical protein
MNTMPPLPAFWPTRVRWSLKATDEKGSDKMGRSKLQKKSSTCENNREKEERGAAWTG